MDRQIPPAFSGVLARHLTFGMVSGFSCFPTLFFFVRISLFLLKTNDALFPAPDRFPQVSFRLRLVSFGHDHHVLRTRNRACIAWPLDFMVPAAASNVVLHHLKKRSRKTMLCAIMMMMRVLLGTCDMLLLGTCALSLLGTCCY